jgi:CheY-like chemotaxis protein
MEKTSPEPSHPDRKLTQARGVLTALTGLLRLAESPSLANEQRAELPSAVLRHGKAFRDLLKGRILVIVGKERPHHYYALKMTFGDDPDVQVIVDRRHGERRQRRAGPSVERRRQERRRQQVEEDLRRIGVAMARPASYVIVGRPAAQGTSTRTPGSLAHRLLVIDDDPRIVELLSAFFETEKNGYAVATAPDGEQGLTAFKAERPDVVLLDMNMPGMNGLEVLKRIRALDKSTPVIIVTAAHYSELSEALKNGAFAYIPKPFDLRYIDHLVAAAVETARRMT